jgi:omega-6 fatty acid desaturase (delta-12 desaturase)
MIGGHGSFFRSRHLNTLLGHLCSAVTFTPCTFWRRQHSNHHACFNNLDRRTADLDIYMKRFPHGDRGGLSMG